MNRLRLSDQFSSLGDEIRRSTSVGELADLHKKVSIAYDILGLHLPEGHAWKIGKKDHSTKLHNRISGLLAAHGMDAVTTSALAFIGFAHDIGRLTEATRKEFGRPAQGSHGKDSRIIIELILQDMAATPFWKAVLAAIEHHDDRTTPSLEALSNNRLTWMLTTFLRDFDKVEGFAKANKYCSDPVEKRRQIEANWKDQRRTDALFGEERGEIVPGQLLQAFEAGSVLPRSECQSYETYMLQLMSWIFDVIYEETLDIIIKEGGPKIVLSYLQSQLSKRQSDQLARIERTITPYGIR